MNGWVDGWMVSWTDRWVVGWVDNIFEGFISRLTLGGTFPKALPERTPQY